MLHTTVALERTRAQLCALRATTEASAARLRAHGLSEADIRETLGETITQAEWLAAEIAVFEAALAGRMPVVRRPGDLGRLLVAARIALRESQAEYGARLGLTQRQVSGHERTEYATMALRRVDALFARLPVSLPGTPPALHLSEPSAETPDGPAGGDVHV